MILILIFIIHPNLTVKIPENFTLKWFQALELIIILLKAASFYLFLYNCLNSSQAIKGPSLFQPGVPFSNCRSFPCRLFPKSTPVTY